MFNKTINIVSIVVITRPNVFYACGHCGSHREMWIWGTVSRSL